VVARASRGRQKRPRERVRGVSESPEATSESAGEGVAETGARLSQGRIHTRSPDVCERTGPGGCGYETRLLGGLGLVHARPVCAIEATEEGATAVSTPGRLVVHGDTASSLRGAGVAARTVGRSGSVRPGDHFATPSPADSVRMWKWLCDRDDLRQPGTNWATPSRADSIYLCFVIDTTNLRQPGTTWPHPPQPIRSSPPATHSSLARAPEAAFGDLARRAPPRGSAVWWPESTESASDAKTPV